MTLRLMLLRHAKAARPADVEDHDRPLAERGEEQAARLGRYMAGQGLLPQLALVSTARRTRDTWQLMQPALGASPPLVLDERLYAASLERALAIIAQTDANVGALLVIGHNPTIHQLALTLAATGRGEALSRLGGGYPTASLAVLDFGTDAWPRIEDGGGKLERYVTPADL